MKVEGGWWKTHPWRLIQTNLREIDMLDMDADRYVADLVGFGATVAMINVGGIIASYPTGLADHFQSPYLKGDGLKEIIDACHAKGIRVVARNDLSKIRRPIYERHPDWAYRTAAGDIVDYNGNVHACLNGGYQQEYAFKIVTEILQMLPVDGMFFNMGGFQVRDYSYNHYGICHCESCRKRFLEETGFGLPSRTTLEDPVFRAYEMKKQEWVEEFDDAIHSLIKSIRQDVAVNHFDFMRQESNTEYGRPLPQWQYTASSNARWIRTSRPDLVNSNSDVDFIGFYYRHVAVSPATHELRLWQNLANGGALDYYLIGRLDNHRDRSGYERVKKVFAYHARNERWYRNLVSEADVLVVRGHGDGFGGEPKGWIRVLTECHYLFDEAVPESLSGISLDKYSCIVLPDVKYLSNAAAAEIDRFAGAGGTVVASGESGFFSDAFENREVPALECLGIRKVTARRDDMRSAMFRIDAPERFPACRDTELLYFGDTYIYADYRGPGETSLRLIPPHMYGPPERCYDTHEEALPGVVVTPHGKGRGVYMPWFPGSLFHREGYLNTAWFMDDVLSCFAGVPKVASTTGPMAEITLQQNTGEGCLLLSIVNMTGHFGTTFYDPVPLADVELCVPCNEKPNRVTSLVDGRNIGFTWDSGLVRVEIDIPGMFECLKIEP